jgi:hypothetical protein
MDKTTARVLAASLEMEIAKLSEALVVAERSLLAEECASIKRHIGLNIGRLSNDVLDPIYAQFPDLAPGGVL